MNCDGWGKLQWVEWLAAALDFQRQNQIPSGNDNQKGKDESAALAGRSRGREADFSTARLTDA